MTAAPIVRMVPAMMVALCLAAAPPLGAQTAATTQTYLIGQNPAATTVSSTAVTNYNGVATNTCNIP